MLTAVATTVELLRFQPQSSRTGEMFEALRRAAHWCHVDLRPTSVYRGGSDLLLLWGPGAPNRFEAMRAQVERGGHVLAFDLAYWNRDRKLRISIDGAHPARWVMAKDWPVTRFAADRPLVADRWDPQGPVIVAGIGRKARVQYGADLVLAWEAAMVRECEARWARPVLYRPKQSDAPVPAGARLMSIAQPIDAALSRSSVVVTWHSNVAVDAIRLGIPVICRDGAAAAVCPSALDVADPVPLPTAVRDRFLANLAWFQWAPSEARQLWAWVREVLA